MSKTSDIHIKVQLDAQNVPEDIQWIAKDGGVDSYSQAKGILISFFEKKCKFRKWIALCFKL